MIPISAIEPLPKPLPDELTGLGLGLKVAPRDGEGEGEAEADLDGDGDRDGEGPTVWPVPGDLVDGARTSIRPHMPQGWAAFERFGSGRRAVVPWTLQ